MKKKIETLTESQKSKLLGCPFCGEIPDFESDVQEVGSYYAVECPGCNAQGPIAEYPDTACDVWDARSKSEIEKHGSAPTPTAQEPHDLRQPSAYKDVPTIATNNGPELPTETQERCQPRAGTGVVALSAYVEGVSKLAHGMIAVFNNMKCRVLWRNNERPWQNEVFLLGLPGGLVVWATADEIKWV